MTQINVATVSPLYTCTVATDSLTMHSTHSIKEGTLSPRMTHSRLPAGKYRCGDSPDNDRAMSRVMCINYSSPLDRMCCVSIYASTDLMNKIKDSAVKSLCREGLHVTFKDTSNANKLLSTTFDLPIPSHTPARYQDASGHDTDMKPIVLNDIRAAYIYCTVCFDVTFEYLPHPVIPNTVVVYGTTVHTPRIKLDSIRIPESRHSRSDSSQDQR